MALMFVLLVAGVKAIAEDVKRHREDRKTNEAKVQILKGDGEIPKWIPLPAFSFLFSCFLSLYQVIPLKVTSDGV